MGGRDDLMEGKPLVGWMIPLGPFPSFGKDETESILILVVNLHVTAL